MMPDRPFCDIADCCHPASFEYYVRWPEGTRKLDVWAVCVHHRLMMRSALKSGLWSGGIRPETIFETRDPAWVE